MVGGRGGRRGVRLLEAGDLHDLLRSKLNVDVLSGARRRADEVGERRRVLRARRSTTSLRGAPPNRWPAAPSSRRAPRSTAGQRDQAGSLRAGDQREPQHGVAQQVGGDDALVDLGELGQSISPGVPALTTIVRVPSRMQPHVSGGDAVGRSRSPASACTPYTGRHQVDAVLGSRPSAGGLADHSDGLVLAHEQRPQPVAAARRARRWPARSGARRTAASPRALGQPGGAAAALARPAGGRADRVDARRRCGRGRRTAPRTRRARGRRPRSSMAWKNVRYTASSVVLASAKFGRRSTVAEVHARPACRPPGTWAAMPAAAQASSSSDDSRAARAPSSMYTSSVSSPSAAQASGSGQRVAGQRAGVEHRARAATASP